MRLTTGLTLIAVAMLAACGGGHKTTTYSAGGQTETVTTDNGNKTTTVQNDKGEKAVVGQGAVDTSKLGAPIYPGATQTNDTAAVNVTTKQGSSQMAGFTSDDSFDKVYSFYKSKLPAGSEKMKVSSGASSIAEFVTGEETTGQTMVMISVKENKTQILITRGTKTQ